MAGKMVRDATDTDEQCDGEIVHQSSHKEFLNSVVAILDRLVGERVLEHVRELASAKLSNGRVDSMYERHDVDLCCIVRTVHPNAQPQCKICSCGIAPSATLAFGRGSMEACSCIASRQSAE